MRLPSRAQWPRLYRYWMRDPLVGARLFATYFALRLLPTDAVSRFGSWIGPHAGRRYRKMNARARLTLQALRPDLVPSEAAMDGAILRMWQAQGRVHAEFAAADRLWAEGRIAVEGLEHLAALKAAGRPVIFAGVHLANWEVLWITVGFLGYRFVDVYQPQANRFEDRIAAIARQRAHARFRARCPHAGVEFIAPSPTAGTQLLRAMRNGNAVMMFVDEFAKGIVHAPAFGRPIRTDGNMARVVRLARLADAAIVPAYVVRTEGARFTVRFLPPLAVQETGSKDADLRVNVAALDAALAPAVRVHLEQWYMLIYFRADA